MKRCVIIGGAGITRYDRVSRFLREDDFCVFCDCGLRHLPFLHRMALQSVEFGDAFFLYRFATNFRPCLRAKIDDGQTAQQKSYQPYANKSSAHCPPLGSVTISVYLPARQHLYDSLIRSVVSVITAESSLSYQGAARRYQAGSGSPCSCWSQRCSTSAFSPTRTAHYPRCRHPSQRGPHRCRGP